MDYNSLASEDGSNLNQSAYDIVSAANKRETAP